MAVSSKAPGKKTEKCTDFCWMIGGPQGTGVDSSATLFARACTVAGYWVYGRREYHSNIKGKHSYFQIRVKNDPVLSHTDPVNLLATFEPSTAEYHAFELVEDGALIYDPKLTDPAKLDLGKNVLLFPIDFDEILKNVSDETGKSVAALAIMKNAIAVAASSALASVPLSAIEEALKGIFTGKKSKLVPLNMKVCTQAYELISSHPDAKKFPYQLVEPVKPEPNTRLLINGNQTTALAKFKAGCKLQTYYSITPAVDECIFMEEHPEYGVVVVQCEDELAALNAAVGAATTGIRSSTSTSGPGFCHMAEGMGYAGICEVPVVVFNYQRGGPSTGLPTRQEQGDLLFAIHSGHGEYPRMVLAPADVTEQFEDSFYAFNYAERYQTPVVVLSDRSIANNTMCVPIFEQKNLKIDRGDVVGTPDSFDENDPATGLEIFDRYEITESGISPRAFAGTPGRIHWLTGDEHTPEGHITEDPVVRIPMHEKRMKKMDLMLNEVPQDFQYKLHGPEKAPITLVSWGSTKGAILDAMRVLKNKHALDVNFLQIRMMHPFPAEPVKQILEKAQMAVCVENNYGGQLSQLIQMRTCFDITDHIRKWSGRPMSETELVDAVLAFKNNKAEAFSPRPNEQERILVLSYGI